MLPAMQVLAGRVSAVDRDARTLSIGPTSVTVPSSLSLAGIDVGTSVSLVYEDLSGSLVAVDLRRLTF